MPVRDQDPVTQRGVPPLRNRRNGVALMLLLAAAAAAAIVFGFFRDDGDLSCESVALSAHDARPAGREDFIAALAALTEAENLARQAGGATGAERSSLLAMAEARFYAGAHDLTHTIDRDLCERDFGLAEDLRQAVRDAEVALGLKEDPAAVQGHLSRVAELLAQAAEELGYGNP